MYMYFSFKKDISGKILKCDSAFCTVCKQGVAHGGGIINLKSYHLTNYRSVYNDL